MSLSWDADKLIKEWLDRQRAKPENSNWTEPFIKACIMTKNPFYSEFANSFTKLPSFDNNKIVRLYCNRTFELKYTDCTIAKFTPTPPRKITFLSDCRLNSSLSIPKITAVPILQSYWTGKKIDIINPPVNLGAVVQRKTSSYFQFSISEFSTHGELFEPLLFSGFMFNGQKIVSELWNFVPLPCAEILRVTDTKCIENIKVVYRLNEVSEKLSLVILIFHPYSQKNGTAVLSAYGKNATSIEDAQQIVQKARSSDITNYCQLGFYIVPLPNLLENEVLPPPFIETETVTEKMLQNIIQGGIKYPAEDKLGITMKIHIAAREIDDSKVMQHNNLLGSMNYPVMEPVLNFRHTLLLELIEANIKLPSWFEDAVYVKVEMKRELDGTGIPLIKDRFSQNHVDFVKSIAVPAHKVINMKETFVLDLPLNIEQGFVVVFTFISIRQKGNKFIEEPIGYSFIHLISNNGKHVALNGGEFELAINDMKSSSPSSMKGNNAYYCKVKATRRSILIPSTASLEKLYSQIKVNIYSLEDYKNVDPTTLLRNSLPIFDALVSNYNYNPSEIFKIFLYFSEISKDICQKSFERFLDVFSVHFAFMHTGNSKHEFHIKLLENWTNFIRSESENIRNGIRRDFTLMNFFFVLLIKSIYVTKDNDFHLEINLFIDTFTKSISSLNKANHQLAIQCLHIFSLFILGLFDIGFYTSAIDAIEAQVRSFGDTKSDVDAMLFFFETTLHPKILSSSLLHMKHFSTFLNSQINRTLVNTQDINELLKIFKILNYNIACLPSNIAADVSLELLSTLEHFPSLILSSSTTDESPYVSTFIFMLENLTPNNFKQFANDKNFVDKFFKSIMKSIDFISYGGHANDSRTDRFSYMHCRTEKELGRTTHNELFRERAFSCQSIMLRFLKRFINEVSFLDYLILTLYQLFCSNLVVNLVENYVDFLRELLLTHPKQIIENKKVVFAKFVMKVLELTRFTEKGAQFFNALYEIDKQTFGSNNRSEAIIQKVIYKMPIFAIAEIVLGQCHTKSLIQKYQKVLKQMESSSQNMELVTSAVFQKLNVFNHSPDAMCEIFTELANYNNMYGNYLEYAMCNITIAALVLEYNYLLGRIKKIFGDDSPAKALKHICPFTEFVICPDNILRDIPNIPSYCDSRYFHIPYICEHIGKISNFCNEKGYYELTLTMIDLVVPFLEFTGDYGLLSSSLMTLSNTASSLSKVTKDQERLLGMYYRVNFFGEIFKDDDRKSFIYREINLTNVFTFSKRITQDMQAMHPGKKIEVITESQKVDESKLLPDVGYIQITSVEPRINKDQRRLKKSQFEEKMFNSIFYFDTPYVRGKNSAQGSIDVQCIRRMTFEVQFPMPFVLKRQQIISVDTKEFDPANVSLRMLKDRVSMMQSYLDQKVTSLIQQQLNGNLLVQVNEGPKRIAEVFLGENSNVDDKTKEKLKAVFKEFLEVNKNALRVHADYVAQNTMFMNMQQELESGYEALSDFLSKYIV